MATLPELLKTMVDLDGSDLHIATNTPPQVRVHGKLARLALPDMQPAETKQLVYSVLTDAQKKRFEETLELDFSFGIKGLARFRCNVFNQRGAVGAVYRLIPEKIRTFGELGLPPVLTTLAERPRGLVLVTGPTGSGQSTTLAAMLDKINNERQEHIITIEDPIEYFHKHNKSLINQREIGVDVPDFPEAIRRALRMDPDIILVGEMRDLATISAAITAAETGHIVFATLHTNSAEGTVNRIIDVFPKDQQDQIRTQLSVAILGILAQALLPRKPKGLVAAYEMLVVTPAISNLIRENKTYRIDSSIQTGRKHGMILLDDSLFNLWKQGLVEENEVMFKSRKPKDLGERIENAKKGIFDEEEAGEEEEE
jgi:twitching motility protein PilT